MIRNLLGKYRFWISIIDLFPESDYICDLEYLFGPKVLEYGRKKLYLRVFLMISLLGELIFLISEIIEII